MQMDKRIMNDDNVIYEKMPGSVSVFQVNCFDNQVTTLI